MGNMKNQLAYTSAKAKINERAGVTHGQGLDFRTASFLSFLSMPSSEETLVPPEMLVPHPSPGPWPDWTLEGVVGSGGGR